MTPWLVANAKLAAVFGVLAGSGGRPTSLVYGEATVWLVSAYRHGPEVLAAARLFLAKVAVGIGAAVGRLAVGLAEADADGWAAGFALSPVLAATSHTPPTTASTATTAPITWLRTRRRLACSARRASCRS